LAAQKKTEIYIPVGKSPGISGKLTTIGKVQAVNLKDSTITIAQDSGNKTIRIVSDTEIYLDKSRLKLTNQRGSLSDIKKGQSVEAKYKDNNPGRGLIEWIKIQLE
jgi:hypothetical protein